jgi:hypothetical protein
MNIKLLRRFSLGYLLLPNLIFFFFWTRLPIAAVGIAVLLFIFADVLRDRDFESSNVLNGKDLLVLGLASTLVTFVSGVAGLAYQTFDYWCHNTKFYELLMYDWPIRIPLDGPVISYYYGYYVVPALISKSVGSINELVIFIWTALGFFLGLAWLYVVLNKKIIYVLLAMAVGDTPHVLKTVFYKITGTMYEMGDFGVESWSNFENLLWVPNQVIPTLIIGGMFVYLLKNKIELEHIVLPVALTFWWAVFPAFTSGLLAAVLIIRKWILKGLKLDWIFVGKTVLLPVLVCAPVLLFFLSHEEAPISGFIWEFSDSMSARVVEYAINIGVNLVIFFLGYIVFRHLAPRTLPPQPYLIILLFILVFPVYRMGKVNDFLFRGLMPYLLIVGTYLFYPFAAMSGKEVLTAVRRSPAHIVLFLMLVSCSFIEAGRIGRALKVNLLTKKMVPEKVAFEPIPYDAYPNIYEVLKDRWSQREADQYLGKKDSVYELNMAPGKPQNNP